MPTVSATTNVGCADIMAILLAANPNKVSIGSGNSNSADTGDTALETVLQTVNGTCSVDSGSPRIMRIVAGFTFTGPATVRELGWLNGTTLWQRVTDSQGWPVTALTSLTVTMGMQQRPTTV